jgi:hypothetical protein
VSDNGASRRCDALGDRAICLCILSQAVNFGSRALLIGAGNGAHCPLIKGIAPNQDMGR